MISQKKILKAINEGIRKSLLQMETNDIDFETTSGERMNQNVKYSSLAYDLITKHNFVDLGLPSKTLWNNFNIGCDSYDVKQAHYGDFFAWGETEVKGEQCSKENYKFMKVLNRLGKKYPQKYTKYGKYIDGTYRLLPEDDIATKVYGQYAHIPTFQQWQELVDNCETRIVANYNGIEGLYGAILTSKINGNSIFLPEAPRQDVLVGQYFDVMCWSSDLVVYENADGLNKNPRSTKELCLFLIRKSEIKEATPKGGLDHHWTQGTNDRWAGLMVRPVANVI